MWRGEVRALETLFFFFFFCAAYLSLFLPLWKGEAFICLLSHRIYPSFFLFMAFNSELEWILWVLMRTSSALTGHLRPHESKHIGQLLDVVCYLPPSSALSWCYDCREGEEGVVMLFMFSSSDFTQGVIFDIWYFATSWHEDWGPALSSSDDNNKGMHASCL